LIRLRRSAAALRGVWLTLLRRKSSGSRHSAVQMVTASPRFDMDFHQNGLVKYEFHLQNNDLRNRLSDL